MPNRLIKESIWNSPSLNPLSDQSELLFYRLLPLPDDHGCFEADPYVIKGRCFPRKDKWTPAVICNQLAALVNAGIISIWIDENRLFGIFHNWSKHQRIRSLHNRKTPEPDIENFNNSTAYEFLTAIDSNCQQLSASDGSYPNPNPNPIEDTCVSDYNFSFELDIIDLYSQHFPPPKFPQLEDPLNTKLGVKVLKQIRARRREMKWGEEISPWSDFFTRANKSHWLTKKNAQKAGESRPMNSQTPSEKSSTNFNSKKVVGDLCEVCQMTRREGCADGFFSFDRDGSRTTSKCPNKKQKDFQDRCRRLLNSAGIPEPYLQKTFDQFELAGNESVFNTVKSWAEKPNGWIYLHGPVGTGKTHLSCAAIQVAIMKGSKGYFASLPDVLWESQPSNNGANELVKRLMEIPLLGLDDLGAHRDTMFAIEVIFRILNRRYMAALPTIITSI
jgi:hypothetical protein